jgi:hypothetical protein
MLHHLICGMIRNLSKRNVFQPSDVRHARLLTDSHDAAD